MPTATTVFSMVERLTQFARYQQRKMGRRRTDISHLTTHNPDDITPMTRTSITLEYYASNELIVCIVYYTNQVCI